MGFSRQEYWSGLPFLSPGDLPDPGIKAESPALQVGSLPSEPSGKPPKTLICSNAGFPIAPRNDRSLVEVFKEMFPLWLEQKWEGDHRCFDLMYC